MLKKISFTQSEFDRLLVWLNGDQDGKGQVEYRCGNDGWIPNTYDIEEIFEMYNDVENSTTLDVSKKRARKKLFIIYLMWIVYTCPNLSKYLDKQILQFLKERMEVVNDPVPKGGNPA